MYFSLEFTTIIFIKAYSCPFNVYRNEVLKYQQTEKQERILLHGEHTKIACPIHACLVLYVANKHI